MGKDKAISSAPGRICLAGEDIDWISGPSILCAINERTKVEVSQPSQKKNVVFSTSGAIEFVHEIDPENIGDYSGHKSDYLNAALKVITTQYDIIKSPVLLNVTSKLPANAGVSSSAALLVATISALSNYYRLHLSQKDICHLAYIAENHELKTGVGQMDLYSCGLGGLIYIDSSETPPHKIESFMFPQEIDVILVDTLSPRNTGDVIQKKRKRMQESEPLILAYVKYTEEAINEMRILLQNSNPDLRQVGNIISNCHSYLRDYMQVSTGLLDECVTRSLGMGAYGAKLTGTGMGGCMFAIADKTDTKRILNTLKDLPVNILVTSPTNLGATIEN